MADKVITRVEIDGEVRPIGTNAKYVYNDNGKTLVSILNEAASIEIKKDDDTLRFEHINIIN